MSLRFHDVDVEAAGSGGAALAAVGRTGRKIRHSPAAVTFTAASAGQTERQCG
ncbi:hypothetical protein [Candidatus Frankia nodulisporulans]|uniref:hypothetical protein n=1 Tax=Candidatus Frankia nodulisporulans TaxID=2060052 RepID=UPI0013D3A66E|nr:hypothetical protein [Candidatus Frankia nodulisporulans]